MKTMSAKPNPSPTPRPAAAPLGTRTPSQPKVKKKRGAQLRNLNALKHGFYAQNTHAHLDLASIGILDDEISAFRLNLHRFIIAESERPRIPYEDLLKTLCLITRTAVCIKRLQRIKRIFRIAVKIDALFAPFRAMLVFLKISLLFLLPPKGENHVR